jgi:hypothetical protein
MIRTGSDIDAKRWCYLDSLTKLENEAERKTKRQQDVTKATEAMKKKYMNMSEVLSGNAQDIS